MKMSINYGWGLTKLETDAKSSMSECIRKNLNSSKYTAEVKRAIDTAKRISKEQRPLNVPDISQAFRQSLCTYCVSKN